MAIESEMAVKGDSKSFYLGRNWNQRTSDADARDGRIVAEFLPSAKRDGFGLVTIECKAVMTEPGVQGGKTELKLSEIGLERVGYSCEEKLCIICILLDGNIEVGGNAADW